MSKPKIRLQRANFLVADIERSLTFYRDVLGFDVVFIKDSDTASYSYDVFEIDRSKPIRFAVLGAPDQPNVMALTEVPGLDPVMDMPRRSAIVLEIRAFDDVAQKAKALGLKVYHEDALVTRDGRKGREIGIVDFDGNLVVVYLIVKTPS